MSKQPEIYGEWKKNEKYDFVFIGAGHNALACAGYLARTGHKVILFESKNLVGGGAMTVEHEDLIGGPYEGLSIMTKERAVPGWKHNIHSQMHGWLWGGPMPRDMELEKYGCRYIQPEIQYSCVFSDGRSITQYKSVDKTCESIAKISKKDAKTYKDFYEEFKGFDDLIMGAFANKPVPYSEFFRVLEQNEMGRKILRWTLSSARKIIDELFEEEYVKVWLMWLICQIANPQDQEGTGFSIPTLVSHTHNHPWAIAVGGSRSLAIALANNVAAHGGTVIGGKKVTKIIFEGNRAVGIKLDSGEEVIAEKAIISSAGVQQTILGMIDESLLDDNILYGAKTYKWDAMVLCTPHLALKVKPHFVAAEKNPDVDESFCFSFGVDTLDEMQTVFNDLREKKLPRMPGGLGCNASIYDRSMVPEGSNGTTPFYWQFTCYDLEGDPYNWEKMREEALEHLLKPWRKACSNVKDDNIVAKFLYTPYDITIGNPHMGKGSMLLGDGTLDNSFTFRPFISGFSYKVPKLQGLYFTGGTTHPMGGITGMCGYNTANQVAEDFNIKKWWK
jgi:phytoene dehydrogenase-like protein